MRSSHPGRARTPARGVVAPAGTLGASGLTFQSMGGSFGSTPGVAVAPGMNPAMFDPKAMSDLAQQLQTVRQANSGNPEAARQATLDVLRGHGYQIPANVPPGPLVLQSPTIMSSGPGFALPGSQGPAPGSAEAILAADAQAGVPTAQPAQGDATGRLQELDCAEGAGGRQRRRIRGAASADSRTRSESLRGPVRRSPRRCGRDGRSADPGAGAGGSPRRSCSTRAAASGR